MAKVIFFTAAALATSAEIAAITALNARAVAPLQVVVRDGSAVNGYGAGRLEPCDYAAGTVPTAYNAKPAVPAGLGVANGGAVNVRNSTAAKTVAGAAVVGASGITSVDLPATAYPVTHGQAIAGVTMTGTAGAGKTATFTIAGGVITAIAFT